MIKKWITAALFLPLCAEVAYAQDVTTDKHKKDESITIHKNGDSKEKLTIVVDGDKITINGKPMSEFKDGSVKIVTDEMNDVFPRIARGFQSPRAITGVRMGNRAMLGVSTEKDDKGARITEVNSESAAEKAGLKKGDIIIRVGDNKITNADELYEAVGKHKPEETVSVTYLRDGKESTVSATLKKGSNAFTMSGDNNFNFTMPEMPEINGFAYAPRGRTRLGLEIKDEEDGKGVKVIDVDEETPAAKAGLKKDDVITSINGKDVKGVDEIREAVRGMKEGDSFKIQYKREGRTMDTEVKFPRKLKTADL